MNEEKKVHRRITIKLPRISAVSGQSIVLILLIIVGLLQTAQLFGLQSAVASSKVKPASSVSVPASGSGSSELPTMVGGC